MKALLDTVATRKALSFNRLRQWSLQLPGCFHVRFTSHSSQSNGLTSDYGPPLDKSLFTSNTPQSIPSPDRNSLGTSFHQTGLNEAVARAVRKAFPNVQQPTLTQAEFIPTILQGRDVLLHDKTGTGKSFGIILALLSKERSKQLGNRLETLPTQHAITSLVIVPHRDLAYQMAYWTEAIYKFMEYTEDVGLKDVVQAVVRGSSVSVESQVFSLRSNPPHILIGTPQALLDICDIDRSVLQIETLSTVAVDEVDYLIDVPSNNIRKNHIENAWKNFRRHPSPTRLLLGDILQARKSGAAKGVPDLKRKSNSPKNEMINSASSSGPPIQVIMSSATVHSNLKDYVTEDMRWMGGADEDYIFVRGPRHRDIQMVRERWEAPAPTVMHHALIVSSDGRLSNIEGARRNLHGLEDATDQPKKLTQNVLTQVLHTPVTSQYPVSSLAGGKKKTKKTDLRSKGEDIFASYFTSHMMEAIATCFALHVPCVALLVLPPSAPVQRAVDDLRDLGVNAHNFDLTSEASPGRVHLLRDFTTEATENPTLLVSAPASTRGIDLPELSHVLILGIPDVANADVFRHMAGRVDRFGRGGKVISFLKDREEEFRDGVMKTTTNEPNLMRLIYGKLGIKPVWLDLDSFGEQ